MAVQWPSISQQRALAYAPKPFAAISFLSSLFVMYYLLIRHPEKRKRIYHRLILATSCCFMPLSFAIFWGTWAMPEETPWAVGASGTSVTCSIQGFLLITFCMAFPFYYSSLSIIAYIALKNSFEEEKYVWIEKWIHGGAYLFPVTVAIVAAVNGWINPGLSSCVLGAPDDCVFFGGTSCQSHIATRINTTLSVIITIELLTGTLAMVLTLCKFNQIEKEADVAIGMTRIVEIARKRRMKEVAMQIALYLMSFWLGYVPIIIEALVRMCTQHINYELITAANCIFSCQGGIILVIYFVLQQKSRRESACILPGPAAEGRTTRDTCTVSQIRANAAMPRRHSSKTIEDRFSFFIFDGTPAEDSPFAAYFDDDSEHSDLGTTVLEEEENGYPENDLVTSLLTDSL